MIWFGNLHRILTTPVPEEFGVASESVRMQYALERVAETSPGLAGNSLLDALVGTGWVDRPLAERLLPTFRGFDADRHFADYLRRLSFRGRHANDEFRSAIRYVTEEMTGNARLDQVGSEPCIRFSVDDHEGVVLAYPEVAFHISGRVRDAVLAAVEEMPDTLVILARNFERGAADQLASLLSRTGVPGTLMTVNLLLGVRAISLRYQPRRARLLGVLGKGGLLRSADVASLGERDPLRMIGI